MHKEASKKKKRAVVVAVAARTDEAKLLEAKVGAIEDADGELLIWHALALKRQAKVLRAMSVHAGGGEERD